MMLNGSPIDDFADIDNVSMFVACLIYHTTHITHFIMVFSAN